MIFPSLKTKTELFMEDNNKKEQAVNRVAGISAKPGLSAAGA